MNSQNTPTVTAEPRQRTGSRYARRLRQAGKVPAVIYGHGQEPDHVALDAQVIVDLLHHGSHLLTVDLGQAGKQTCLVKDVQYDYLGDHVVHVDLVRVDLSEKVTVSVPVECTSEDTCAGLKHAGAYLEHMLTELEVECRADQIPDLITVDIRDLEVGQTITVADLVLPPGVKAVHSPDSAVVAVHMSRAVEEEEAVTAGEEAAEAAEPEVIGKAKEQDKAGEE